MGGVHALQEASNSCYVEHTERRLVFVLVVGWEVCKTSFSVQLTPSCTVYNNNNDLLLNLVSLGWIY